MTDTIYRADAIGAVCRDCTMELYGKEECEVYKSGNCGSVNAISAPPSAEADPTVIRSRTFMPTKDFREWAKRIREVNPNAVVIPCDAEVVSAEAVQGEWKQTEINGYKYAVCDQCHLLADMVEKDGKFVMSMANADDEYANYCPNCGARMKGGAE